MSKDKLTDYDATASNNTDVGGISVAEGMLPSGVNNALRELMSHQADAFGAGTPLYVDQTNNRLGVGTVSPNQLLEVANSSGGATISISTDEAAGSIASKKYLNLDFAGYNNAVMARVQSWDESSSTGSGYLTFHTTPSAGGSLTERMRILSSGGITFNGDTAAANALDDYEEGTWTPTLLGTTSNPTLSSIANTTGHYVKIGNMVHVTYYAPVIVFTSAGSGTSQIGGLPFTAANGTEEYWLFQYLHGDALNGTTTGGYINKNGNIMSFVAQGSTASVPWQSSGSRYLMISASYRAA